MPRLFVAIRLPDPFKEAVRALQSGLPSARWLKAGGLHLTVAFVGDVDDRTHLRVETGLDIVSTPAFSMELRGLGRFPPRGAPRVLWVGVAPQPGVAALADAVRSALRNIGMLTERRKFLPHITIARFRQRPEGAEVQRYLAANEHFRTGQTNIASFHLFSSELRPDGARYTIEKTFPLTRAPRQGIDSAR